MLSAALIGCAIAGCATTTAPLESSHDIAPAVDPLLVTVRLDVSGPGLGVITHSTSGGRTLTTDRVVLQGWSTSYDAYPDAPVVLSVSRSLLGDVSCAVHISGRLVTNVISPQPDCGMREV